MASVILGLSISVGMFILGSGTAHAQTLYSIIFIVVLISMIVQGGLIPYLASKFRVPMRHLEQQP
ncbi:hypothetical protein IV498_13985 [Paenarthrobacter sp. Z7-10]|uniref:hypothetical protein n=1 Tax=Paenarthrobacter sp. Z7-10 TaxID=2787635 RepID=UPI0022A9B3B0|nr:hypothetical protein [Paenarthrobacter sp. Z7-10]MCZ2404259.1 hypothetical protein [Paenarthrobacter sp. Z7-10]